MAARIHSLIRHQWAGLLALSIALGGVAYAAIPGPTGVFHGCRAKTDGVVLNIPHSKGDLRLVQPGEACRSYEAAVSWNEEGQQGDPGPANAFATGDGNGERIETPGPIFQQGLPLAAGKYVLTAALSIDDADFLNSTVFCQLHDSSGALTGQQTFLRSGDQTTMALQGTTTLPAADTIELTCTASNPQHNLFANNPSIDAIEVTTINGS